MRKLLLCLCMGLCLVLTLLRVESRAADPAVVRDLDKASKDATARKWDDIVKEPGDLAKHDISNLMEVLARREAKGNRAGGIGIGAKPGAVDPDGIEAKIINMTRNGIPQKEMASNQADFKKMADQLAAIAAAAANQTPKKKSNDPGADIWKKSSKDMFEKAQEFARAIESKDNAKIKTAAKALDGTCKSCHTIYK